MSSHALQFTIIQSFKHRGLERLFKASDFCGVQAQHAPRIVRLLDAIDAATDVVALDVPGWHLHRLKGDKKNLWSLKVSGNWRLTFEFDNGDAHILNLEDYH